MTVQRVADDLSAPDAEIVQLRPAVDPVRPAEEYLTAPRDLSGGRRARVTHEGLLTWTEPQRAPPNVQPDVVERPFIVDVVERRPHALRVLISRGGLRLVGYYPRSAFEPVLRRDVLLRTPSPRVDAFVVVRAGLAVGAIPTVGRTIWWEREVGDWSVAGRLDRSEIALTFRTGRATVASHRLHVTGGSALLDEPGGHVIARTRAATVVWGRVVSRRQGMIEIAGETAELRLRGWLPTDRVTVHGVDGYDPEPPVQPQWGFVWDVPVSLYRGTWLYANATSVIGIVAAFRARVDRRGNDRNGFVPVRVAASSLSQPLEFWISRGAYDIGRERDRVRGQRLTVRSVQGSALARQAIGRLLRVVESEFGSCVDDAEGRNSAVHGVVTVQVDPGHPLFVAEATDNGRATRGLGQCMALALDTANWPGRKPFHPKHMGMPSTLLAGRVTWTVRNTDELVDAVGVDRRR